MGYGFPAAVAMKRLYPERPVVALAGDGDFLMTGQEFATAVQYGLPIVTIVADNGIYGTIRMHQERDFPAASPAQTWSTPTSPPTPAPSAGSASPWRPLPGSKRRSARPRPAACRPSCT